MSCKKFAVNVAYEAGAIIRKNFSVVMKKRWKSSDHDESPVTKTDMAVNRLLIKRVRAAYPTHDIIGEGQ